MIKELRHKRKQLIDQYRTIAKQAETRDLTPEEQTQIADLQTKVADIDARLKTLEDMEAMEDEGTAGDPEMDSERSLGRKGAAIENQNRDLPDTDGKHKYSLMKVVRSIAGIAKLDGLEAEMHQELVKRSGGSKGVRIPWHLATHRSSVTPSGRRQERRDLTTSTGTGSIANILGTDFIDLLRNKMVTQMLGAKVLSGMTGGTFSLPKQTAAGSAYWVAEGVAPTASNQTIGQVTFTPKTLGAFTDLSRKFILQTSIDAEAFVKDDLSAILAIEMDRAGINGSGSGAEPTGILQMGSVAVVALGTNGAAPTYGPFVDMESAVAIANADVGNLAYLTSAAGRGVLKKTLKLVNTAGKSIWEDDEVNGYRAEASQQVPSNLTKGSGTALSAVIYGNWASLCYAMWGGMDLIEDPYTKSNVGGIRLVMLQDLDIQARYQQSFAKIVDLITT